MDYEPQIPQNPEPENPPLSPEPPEPPVENPNPFDGGLPPYPKAPPPPSPYGNQGAPNPNPNPYAPPQPPVMPQYVQQQPPYVGQPPYVNNMQGNGGSGLAIASMVLGIIAILCNCCIWFAALPCAIVGLILGIVALYRSSSSRGMAIAGIILSSITLVLLLLLLFAVIGYGASDLYNFYDFLD